MTMVKVGFLLRIHCSVGVPGWTQYPIASLLMRNCLNTQRTILYCSIKILVQAQNWNWRSIKHCRSVGFGAFNVKKTSPICTSSSCLYNTVQLVCTPSSIGIPMFIKFSPHTTCRNFLRKPKVEVGRHWVEFSYAQQGRLGQQFMSLHCILQQKLKFVLDGDDNGRHHGSALISGFLLHGGPTSGLVYCCRYVQETPSRCS